jgi:hypothetical protein
MGDEAKAITDMLPFLIPLIIVELGLMIFALVDLLKREYYKTDTKIIWAIVIVIFGIIGPVIYFIFGRKEQPVDSNQD